MKKILFILILLSYQGISQGELFGYYTGKTAEIGQFVTRIQLNQDWTFKYDFEGDLAYNWGYGEYSIDTDQVVILNFGKSDLDSTQQIIRSISGGHEVFETMFYVFKKGKLYPLKKNGKLDKKGYLIRRDIERPIWRFEKFSS